MHPPQGNTLPKRKKRSGEGGRRTPHHGEKAPLPLPDETVTPNFEGRIPGDVPEVGRRTPHRGPRSDTEPQMPLPPAPPYQILQPGEPGSYSTDQKKASNEKQKRKRSLPIRAAMGAS